MARYSKPMRSRAKGSTADQGSDTPTPSGTTKTKKSKFYNAKSGYRYSEQRSITTLNGRVFNAKMSPTVTRVEFAIEYFKRNKYIACSDDKARHMTNSLIDDRSRKMLNTLGCSVENSYPAYYYYREDSGEKYAKKGIEHLKNAAIIDPEFSMLSPEPMKIKDAFPNKNDPIYQLDDDLPKGTKRDAKRYRRAKNNCAVNLHIK